MTELNRTTNPEDARLTEAAAWRVRLSEADAEVAGSFEKWLAEPGNAEAWAQVQETWNYIGIVAGEPEIVDARHAALGDARRTCAKRRPVQFWRMAAGIAAALLIAVVGTWGTVSWLQAPSRYATEVGEQWIITLKDGSRISLDSGSEVTVDYSRTARELRLLRGQARFDVARDVERPFSVVAGDRKVVATGTVFNIDITAGRIVVTLIQGHVAILREQISKNLTLPDKSPIELEPGQQLVETGAKVHVAPVDIQRVTAWTNGQLIFENDTLNDVVERMNRYTTTPITIADARVGAMRISGVFNSSDMAGFVETVTNYLPVQTETDGSGRVVLRAKQ